MKTVKATREGLIGKPTATGFRIDKKTPFVALPTVDALYRFIHIHSFETDKRCIAIVLDVGPWNIDDDNYVFGNENPLSMQRIKTDGKTPPKRIEGDTNGAGIDLSEAVWRALGLPSNGGSGMVEWEFITPYSSSIQSIIGK